MIPIFIITRDRVSVLKKSIASYMPLGDIEIVIHDNNSTYPLMLDYLKELEDNGIKVYRHPNTTNTFNDISEDVEDTIADWYVSNDSPYYIVTDPDIELENPSPRLLEYYKDLLDHEYHATVVGPMLRIDDLPDCFHLKNEMVESHIYQFWGHTPTPYKESKVLQGCMIDTTFGMYRKGFKFRRLNRGMRVYEPYMARHLDWYIDTKNLTEEQEYYMAHASNVSSMTNHIKRGVKV